MGFAVWIDKHEQVAWAQGTHEYRPMGTAVIALGDGFRRADFRLSVRRPRALRACFAGFFCSLEEVNHHVRNWKVRSLRPTPAHLI